MTINPYKFTYNDKWRCAEPWRDTVQILSTLVYCQAQKLVLMKSFVFLTCQSIARFCHSSQSRRVLQQPVILPVAILEHHCQVALMMQQKAKVCCRQHLAVSPEHCTTWVILMAAYFLPSMSHVLQGNAEQVCHLLKLTPYHWCSYLPNINAI